MRGAMVKQGPCGSCAIAWHGSGGHRGQPGAPEVTEEDEEVAPEN